jgi:MipA family protein
MQWILKTQRVLVGLAAGACWTGASVRAQDVATPPHPAPTEASASAPVSTPDDSTQPNTVSKPPPKWGYVVGAAVVLAPPYPGAGFNTSKVRPLLAMQYGRIRISTSRAHAMLGFGSDVAGSGVSADLLESRRWRFGVAFRIDSGRKSAEAQQLTGLPNIESTLLGRAYASYALTDRWSLSGNVSQDFLNRGGGTTLGHGLGYRAPLKLLGQHTEWTAGLGLTYMSAERLKTRYGITTEQSATTGLPAFTPRAGYADFGTGVGLTTTIGPSWVFFANTSWTHLLGDAARSPLTLDSRSRFTSIGLAYRCCR